MPEMFTKEILACQAFVNVKFNGVLKLMGQSNIRESDTSSRCK